MMKAFGWYKAVEYLVRIDRNNENHTCCIYVGIDAMYTIIWQDMKMEIWCVMLILLWLYF